MNDMPKAYEPQGKEDAIYKMWLDSGYFNPDNLSGEPYSIMMPPPNVTGILHLGHALENSLMDSMARYQRLRGKKVLIVPGTDHAAIATQAKVEKRLLESREVKSNPRQELGREKLVEKIREFAEESKATILSQVKKIGTSADWSRLAYTFDEIRSKAVNELFARMYKDGLIYRGFRVVNWSVKGQSTCSDDEIETIERQAVLYTFKYSKDFPIRISTTRPETKVGDTAVAVHPDDVRYQKYIGQTFNVDFAGVKLSIKIIADEGVDPAFGTGALGVTPAHSAIDFAMYEKQKANGEPIGIVQVIGADGKMTADAGVAAGLPVTAKDGTFPAREAVVSWLIENQLIDSNEDSGDIKEITQNVGTSDRYGDVIEAIPMTQWWLDVNKVIPSRGKTLRDLMREAVTTGLNGDVTQKVNITPERFTKLYLDRVDNLRDWCLSRQLWWGHRIPAWHRGEETVVGEMPAGEGWTQDEDTLDTWFSSGSWTFSTLGWPNGTKDLETFHPTNWMQMGYEILYLWLMRMILMSTYALEEIPFKDAYIHGILRDKDGKKFSKSSGNGIDPIEVINEYGCDALRMSLLVGISPGNDSRYYTEKIEGAKHLVNKIWNISRFILTAAVGEGLRPSRSTGEVKITPRTLADRWILGRFSEVSAKVGMLIEQFDFSLAAETLRDFTWNEFADWYLEIAKIESNKDEILLFILERLLILWHPFMPFVTEEIYKNFDKGLIMVAKWPTDVNFKLDDAERKLFAETQEVVAGFRNIRAQYKIDPKTSLEASISGGDELKVMYPIVEKMARVTLSTGDSTNSAKAVVGKYTLAVSLVGIVDVAKERARLEKELATTEKYVISVAAKLENAEFVKNAPAKVIDQEKAKLDEAKKKLEALKEQISVL